MPKILVPSAYRGPTKGEAEVWVEGKTIRECLDAVEALHPGFEGLVFDADGQLPNFVRLFLNGVSVDTEVLDTPVAEDDEVSVLAAIAGG